MLLAKFQGAAFFHIFHVREEICSTGAEGSPLRPHKGSRHWRELTLVEGRTDIRKQVLDAMMKPLSTPTS